MNSHAAFLNTLIILLILPCWSSLDTITPDHPIKDGDVLISGRQSYALGFFSPGNSHYRYVGIWYYRVPEKTVVWVANRDNPINDTSGILTINSRGGLVIYGENRNSPIWSANVSVSSANSSVAKLLDVGNLVLYGNSRSQSVLWQSFDHPTHTMLPFMKLGLNRKSGLDRFLTSWRSLDDPGTGNSSLRVDPSGHPQVVLYKNGAPSWRGGPWTGSGLSGVPEMRSNFIFNVSFVDNQDELFITYGIHNDSIFSRMVIDESGVVHRSTWHDQGQHWVEFWSAPRDLCDDYKQCGANGNCDPSTTNKFECTCLPGFEPKSPRDWFLRDGSGGCLRKKGVSTCGSGEGFVKLTHMKVPDTSKARVQMNLSLEGCRQECLRNCSCTAYTSADERGAGIGCLMWYGDLVDGRTYSAAGQELHVRVDNITLAEYSKKSRSLSKVGKVAISLACIVVLFLVIVVHCWAKKKRKAKAEQSKHLSSLTTSPTFSQVSLKNEFDESRRGSELLFFDLNTIAAATDNFAIHNKLGEGGFGSVYKGMIYGRKEIAIKRLSKHSGQGTEEFKNEIMLIAKLQHRNLVRLLGCCVQGEEKMLIYEYLPNKSLDAFIFDEEKRKLLDWRKRFDIICGIARGMLYLHQDSRLRIIHRDLKASNVLLDEVMNPKIADFGMARIFGGNQLEANTNRVVGTYGYMSPEYAMQGRFSIKSDVYSFGVLLLEIITGKKNTSYYHENPETNLVGHVWDLWRDGKALELMDSSLDESYGGEALRCIIIGLLCVQEFAADRPTMSAVVSMLGNDSALPSPKQPAFVYKKSYTSGDPSTSEGANSIYDVTCTVVEPR
ncbi:G-type lectin S-receptor-like serine/threonine-protein kinase At1g11410 isoform X1 [Morus notabilis]|uniref:G-type lectin S-receptor-like serine/threonine-protein kinase At1g11410 isoform X1 n=1 Tax=Morus notabilis TaxID=981085 RepID=UPI000CED4452|nr:G-type lectin S-receptor-like serine/threonine-protein kinase At1g11410 isoform X1 [Morus notabilis]